MARHEKMEDWEEELARQGQAIQHMRKIGAGPTVLGHRITGAKRAHKSQEVATLHNREKWALYVV